MRKIIAAINMTLDGICDHTVILPDAEIHQHYSDLLRDADVILYGRITYQLMEYWQTLVKNPSGEKSMDDFALAMDKIPKIVFSHTLKNTTWHSAEFSDRPIKDVAVELKKQSDGAILVGSRSILIQLMKLKLIDEFQLCIHPVVAGGGLPLFEHMHERTTFKLKKSKTFAGGAVIHYYQQENDNQQTTNIV